MLERGATDGLDLLLRFGDREEEAEGDLVSAGGAVGELRDGDIVAVADLEIVGLEAYHEDESIGVFDAVAIPDADKEGKPVKVDAIVKIVKAALVLVDEIGGDDRGAEAEGGGATFLLGDVDKTAGIDSKFERDTVLGVEALVRLAEVVGGDADIPVAAVGQDAGGEIGIPFACLVGRSDAGAIDVARDRVDHIGETEELLVPGKTRIADTGLEAGIDKYFLSDLETEGIHDTEIGSAEHAMVALTVVHDDGTDATVQSIDILVIRSGDGRIGADEAGPLMTIGQREAGSHLGTGKSGIHIERVGIELRESDILSTDSGEKSQSQKT